MSLIKIRGGTLSSNERFGLCTRCSWSHITEDRTGGRVYCTQNEGYFSSPVLSCNRFHDATIPNRRDFEEIAWKIDINRKTGKVGFQSPEDQRKEGS